MLLEYLHMCEHLINVAIFVQLWSSSIMLLPDSYCAHTSTEREVLVICDKGKSVNPLLLQQELEPSYHNCHLKPAPASPSPVSASALSYFDLIVFWWPAVFLIHTNQISIHGDGKAILSRPPHWGLLSQQSPVSASDWYHHHHHHLSSVPVFISHINQTIFLKRKTALSSQQSPVSAPD